MELVNNLWFLVNKLGYEKLLYKKHLKTIKVAVNHKCAERSTNNVLCQYHILHSLRLGKPCFVL